MSKKFNFEAETGRVLELLTHSIYSNKEIFLRELISNASDAIDKARLKSLTDATFLGENTKFEIKIWKDKEKNIIYLEDNGIGMTEEELHSCIGTIAKSGTKEFLEKLKKAKEDGEHNLIGQFGVGFYSAFMVADKVQIDTKSPLDTKAHRWLSDGKSEYEVSESERQARGTIITLFIDEANKELLEEWKIKELIKKYSNYVAFPILLQVEKEEKAEEGKEAKKELVWEQINETKPIWQKSKNELKKDDYNKFYTEISYDFKEPLTYTHINVEGAVSYKSILFVPEEKNMFVNIADPNTEYGSKLYVQNVLILEHAKDLLPVWLRFVSGVVETQDIPLNISREMLQSNSVLEKIKKNLIKKVLGELQKSMKENKEKYDIFLSHFGNILKEGIYYDTELKEEIAGVIKFKSMLENKMISLDEYREKLGEKDELKTIFYITGKSEQEVLASPYIAQFRENKVDILLLTNPIDEWLIQSLPQYKEYKLKSITASDIELKKATEEEIKEQETTKKDFKDLLELIKNTIGAEKIEKVELSDKIGENVGALKTPENGLTPQMEKMMKAMGQSMGKQKRIFELNPKNEVVQMMKQEFEKDLKSEKLKDMILYAYEQAILLEGGELENVAEFVKRVNKFVGK
ncbi:molecular chaperone HtpG [Candidatus Gracilibacteria bacterium]|nr:molecular chaperone HtpG [Candidatus Gracilibacteria bacterium]NUJ98504.1 molecular chaperone HtpG [Candidatus Gracilibacteria bacterium]